MAKIKIKVTGDDGCSHESSGSIPDEVAFAIWALLGWAGHREPIANDLPHVSEFRSAVRAFICATATYRSAITPKAGAR